MLKKLILILTLFAVFPVAAAAQTLKPTQATSSSAPVIRNRLQLLTDTGGNSVNTRYARIRNRIKAFTRRLNSINSRLGKRIDKIDISSTVARKLAADLEIQTAALTGLEQGMTSLDQTWNKLLQSDSKADYASFKKQLDSLITSLDSVIKGQQAILTQLKRYKSKTVPTVTEATESTQIQAQPQP